MFLNGIAPDDKIFYTTGRLTSEMVIKTVKMRIPMLVSRSGFTAWGVELAQKAGLTLIGRARGKRFVALSGARTHRVRCRSRAAEDEDRRHARKSSHAEARIRTHERRTPFGSHGRRTGRRPVAPHGRRRQGAARTGRQADAGPRHRSAGTAGRPLAHQRQRRSGTVCHLRPARRGRYRRGLCGPLAGVLAGMRWSAGNAPAARWIVTAAGDAPMLPPIWWRGWQPRSGPKTAIALARRPARCIP